MDIPFLKNLPFGQSQETVSVYLGKDGVGFARVIPKKEILTTFISYASIEEEINAENLTEDIKLEALIRKGLREIKTETKEVFVGVYENDVIFRFFDVPQMSRKEALVSIPIEAEKYIPFKIEDMLWDFVTQKKMKAKATDVGFVGIKKELVERYRTVFGNLGLTIKNIHPTGMAFARMLKNGRKIAPGTKNFAVLSCWGSEVDVYIFNDRFFPCFGRCSKVSLRADKELDMLKFLDDLRLTFDYYRRELSGEVVERIYIITEEGYRDYFATFSADLNMPVEIFTPATLVDKLSFENMETLKAYAIALRRSLPYPFEIDLARSYQPKAPGLSLSMPKIDVGKLIQKGTPKEIVPVPLNFKVIGSALVIAGAILGTFLLQESKKLDEKNSEWLRVQKDYLITDDAKNLSLETIKAKISNLEKSVAQVREKEKVYLQPVSGYFDALAKILSPGVWFESLNFSNDAFSKFSFNGYVFLADEQREMKSLNDFIDKLRQEDSFGPGIISEANPQFTERGDLEGYGVTKFSMEVKLAVKVKK